MTASEVLDVLEFIRACYPNFAVTERTIDAYTVMLADLPHEAVKKAVVSHAATSRFAPTVAELRQRTMEYVHDPIPDVDDAYHEAREYAKHRYNPNDGPMTAAMLEQVGLRPLTARALASVGVDVMATTTEPSVVAAQFKAAYQRLSDSEHRRRLLPPAAAPLPGAAGNGSLAEAKERLLTAWRVED